MQSGVNAVQLVCDPGVTVSVNTGLRSFFLGYSFGSIRGGQWSSPRHFIAFVHSALRKALAVPHRYQYFARKSHRTLPGLP
jgi:hypothetical protein